jgi:hypothetical protein
LAVVLGLHNAQANGDVYKLQDLLNGESITSNGFTYGNFRSYGDTVDPYGHYVYAMPASTIEVITLNGGLEFTGTNGALVNSIGQGPLGAQFTFDVAPTNPLNLINLTALSVTGTVSGDNTPFGYTPAYFSGSLSVVGANPSPLSLVATQANYGSNVISSSPGAIGTFSGVNSLSVTESFSASGLTDHGPVANASIGNVSVFFVPEPSPLQLVGVLGTVMTIVAGARRHGRRLLAR